MVRILVVDDSVDTARPLVALLRLNGFEAEAITDGTHAVEVCRGYGPAVVLLDLVMPGTSGLEIAKRLRADGTPARIIALTGYGAECARTAPEFDAFLLKPAGIDEILAAIETVLLIYA